jgi:2-keto-4-pentenoate hydratase
MREDHEAQEHCQRREGGTVGEPDRSAELGRRPIAPPSEPRPWPAVVAAYAVQDVGTGLWQAGGERSVGWTAGASFLPVRRQLGVDESDFGVLFRSTVMPHAVIGPWAAAPVGLRGHSLGRSRPSRPEVSGS